MKYQIMIGILFTLLSKRRVSAGELAARYDVSVRTIYRYIDEMTCANIPIDVARGAGGGIYISDAFKLPKGLMTREEYARAVDAIVAMYSETGDEVLESAAEKLSALMKSEKADGALYGNVLVDSGTWGDERKFSEKLSCIARAVESRAVIEIDYVDRGGERSRRAVLPHLLVYKQSVWYVWAYCRMRQAFRLFKIGRVRSLVETGEVFERVPFRRDEIPLSFWRDGEHAVDARFSISKETLPFAEEWLGIENVYAEGEKYFAEARLPDDDALLGKILSAGAGFEVIAPASLRRRVQEEAEKIASAYRA